MDKLNLKNVLTAVRDMIMRNRVAYKDYLGSETVTKTNIIVEGILVEEGTLTLKDSSVTSFVIGESYDVTIDGVTEVMIAYDLSENSTGYGAPATNDNIIALGNVTDLSNIPSDGWVVAIGDGTAVCKTLGSYIGKSISISQTKTITEKHYDIKKLPYELLPNTVAKKTDVTAVKKLATNAQTLAETAQTAADNAQTTANAAKTTAENAQTTAENAQTTAERALPFKPAGNSYLTFSSPNSFTLAVNDATKHWDGTIEYFASDKTWTVWTAWQSPGILSAVDNGGEYVLYLRGIGNTVITGYNLSSEWVLSGTDIKCIGNIENLLDYKTVESGKHPTMESSCYYALFKDCTSLIQAPDLPAPTLTVSGYSYMFSGCTSLIKAPALPATTLAGYCYSQMFSGCTGLIQAPDLPATTLANDCYSAMFRACTGLVQAPDLPATTLAQNCYSSMFNGCTRLTQAPALPATTLEEYCYRGMFQGCTRLTQAPALPATTLEDECYSGMFNGCTSLTQVPELPATMLAQYCYREMFQGCTSLKFSSTKTREYTAAYRIPISGTGAIAPGNISLGVLDRMFASTGGTFTGTPALNTTYYLSSDNMIVRETETSTLNGYVKTMIDAAVEIDNETIVKTEDGKLKANVSLPSPATNGSLLRGDTNNSKWSEIDANGGYGWKEIKEPIIYTSDMYDSAEKVYYTDAETGEQSVFLVKISDDVITLDEAKGICSLTMWYEGESFTQNFTEPPYSNYVAQFGTTGVSLMSGQVMSCSQEEDAKDLFGEKEPFIIPAGTWLQAEIASNYSSVEIAHGLINKIEEGYIPSNVAVFNLYTVSDDASFNENIRAKFHKGLTLITDDGYLIQSVSDSESSFTCTKSDGLLYKYTLTDGNWSSSEIFLQSSALFTGDITGLAASFNEVPCTQSVYNLVNGIALPSGMYDGDIAIWDTTNKRWKIATHADGGYGYADYTTGETFKISDRFLPDNTVKIKEITDDHVLHSSIKDDLESGYTVYWNVGAYPSEGGRIIDWEIVSDEVPTNCKYILTFDRSPGVKKIYTPNADYNHLIIYNYTAEPTQKALYLKDKLGAKNFKIEVDVDGSPRIMNIEDNTKFWEPPSLDNVVRNGDKAIRLCSSTADSTKQFKITVDDSGTISAAEVT